MQPLEWYSFSAVCSAFFLVSCILFAKVSREQRDPYMDELFHVSQAQKYCDGKFTEWDPMITTLPGMYLMSVGMLQPVVWLLKWKQSIVCSTGMLRFLNLLFSAGNLYLLYLLVCRIHHKDKSCSAFQRIVSALVLASFPLLYFFTFLYYTDPGSTFFTLFAYLMCLYGNHGTSAMLAFCAFMFRQTNIIWVVFCAGSLIAQKLAEEWKTELKKKDEKSSPAKGSLLEIKQALQFIAKYMLSLNNMKNLLWMTWPYVLLVIGFFVFVGVNKGIVVGDRSSHEACFNFPQLFYFLSFTLVFSFSHLISLQKVTHFLKAVQRSPLLYTFIFVLSSLLVWKFTYVHKYLLADNRHYTFYVWKNIFQRHDFVKYFLIPGYVFAGWSVADELKSKSVFWNLMFCTCLVAATVPQMLLEFRYFIIPYLIYRLNIAIPSAPKLLLELAFYVVVNCVTVYLFINKTFKWPDVDELQRFMW
ncbi:putative Dol-P-Glc:Glc(2)Man(9)GlcNAc(2)-PP-Dol alpha-1,2-glucosyltransferase [Protopterus annectens]|uniref:putative Dol-P-Glc:Glc(2)Man(9)GlcNAc(2)-PP-Dol alpha-1,2-glucosyltransferase n=1 Tax=Protopterus annectens TaxID=7888 RepID=UPI001CFA398A|nr:putative Dol-P-Glc:Glc(2)Man(9)GlcNAc(2)-PP-Dol alpha-1,2-glucosyltransferase [Protopterus annectens]